MEKEIITKSTGDTYKLASQIITKYKDNNAFLLEGELGSGKTTFVKAIAKKLGLKQKIQSPTFVLEKKYKITNNLINKNIKVIIHIDLYRLKKNDCIIRDLSENFFNKDQYTFIEWPDRLGDYMPKKYILLKFNHINENTRSIVIKKFDN